jgi:hypothetical protein
VLVVRAWLHGDPPSVAARITYTVDVSRPDRVTVAVAGEDELARVISRWLHEVVAGATTGDGPVTEA